MLEHTVKKLNFVDFCKGRMVTRVSLIRSSKNWQWLQKLKIIRLSYVFRHLQYLHSFNHKALLAVTKGCYILHMCKKGLQFIFRIKKQRRLKNIFFKKQNVSRPVNSKFAESLDVARNISSKKIDMDIRK